LEYILSAALFAVSSSITPGPNNIMVMASGLNFGIRKSLPLLTGICVGFSVMLLLVGLGFGHLFSMFPSLILFVKITGTAYLLYLAWLIATSSDIDNSKQQNEPFGFIKGALFQWVNGKAWVVAIGAISAFTSVGEHYSLQVLNISTTFFVISFPCVGVWLIFGSLLRDYFENVTYLRWFNISMSLLLVLSIIPVISEIYQQPSN